MFAYSCFIVMALFFNCSTWGVIFNSFLKACASVSGENGKSLALHPVNLESFLLWMESSMCGTTNIGSYKDGYTGSCTGQV